MKKVILLGNAFVGLIVGAGFASGKEIYQYFSVFGSHGFYAIILATVLLSYIGMTLLWLGRKLNATNHHDVIKYITGNTIIGKIIAKIIDYVQILSLFGLGIVMLAGAGSSLQQQLNIPNFIGTLIIAVLIIVVGMLNVTNVIRIMASITPFLVIFILIVSVYSLIQFDGNFEQVNTFAKDQSTSLPNWVVSSINYVALNTALCTPMALVMGGVQKSEKVSLIGGLLGGIILGLMIFLIYLTILFKITDIYSSPIPMLSIIKDISPTLGIFMVFVIYLMIFNTGLGMFYSLSSRLFIPESIKFKKFHIIIVTIGFIISLVGFSKLVAFIYPIIGYMGILLIIVLIYAPFKIKLKKPVED